MPLPPHVSVRTPPLLALASSADVVTSARSAPAPAAARPEGWAPAAAGERGSYGRLAAWLTGRVRSHEHVPLTTARRCSTRSVLTDRARHTRLCRTFAWLGRPRATEIAAAVTPPDRSVPSICQKADYPKTQPLSRAGRAPFPASLPPSVQMSPLYAAKSRTGGIEKRLAVLDKSSTCCSYLFGGLRRMHHPRTAAAASSSTDLPDLHPPRPVD